MYNLTYIMKNVRIKLIKEEHRPIVFELLSKLKAHSKESFVHSIDVADKSLALARVLGIRGVHLERLYVASLLHDVGKVYVDESILHNSNTTEEEREYIRVVHIEGTRSILSEYFDEELVDLAPHHHERLNSSGYPMHLNAKKLGLLDRVLQVADVTSALEMSRCYKDAYAPEQVIEILDKLVSRGELDKRCVKEIEKLFLKPLRDKSQMTS